MRGLILFAHGARDPRWASPFVQTAERLRVLEPDCRVELAYLEFMPPDLATAGHTLALAGCLQVDVLPMFLGTGGHVRKDLPELVQALRGSHPGIDWRLHPAIGESPLLVDAMAGIALSLGGAPAP
jgi:sirohydrochlorin cobaltochelatase